MRTVKFKASEIGPIPADWEVKRLGELFSFKNGYNTDAKNYGRGMPVASVLEALADRPLKASKIRGKVIAPQKDQDTFSLKRGDLIFTRSSETLEDVGRSNVYDDNDPAMFGGFIIRGRPKTEHNSTCINLMLKTRAHRDRVMSQGAGAQHYNIGQSGLGKVLVAIPPRAEQEKIAEALSDMDALSSAMTTLIEKKRAIKQGAMQQLLTGKKRLAGFTGPWVEKRICDIGQVVTGATPPRNSDSNWTGNFPWISAKDFKGKYIWDSEEHISDSGRMFCRILPANSVLVTCIASIGLNAISKVSCATNQQINAVVCKTWDTEFFYYQICRMCEDLKQIAGQTAVPIIGKSQFEQMSISGPSDFAEQKVIAEVLSDMDAEIAALESKRAKYESVKQGMMQELLTGKTRLV